MPKFSRKIKTFPFNDGPHIPQSASLAVQGTRSGTYFFWKGAWHFTIVDGFYIEAPDFSAKHHTSHTIEKLE